MNNKKFFIYQVLGWPDGPLALITVKVPGTQHAYYVHSIRGYETVEEAEEQLRAQEEDEKLTGEFVILPVYRLGVN